jgi:hypothetical protein
VHSPTVEGWALLDGGVTAVSGYGLTTLPHGLRVLGFGALRFLLAGVGVAGPDEPFPTSARSTSTSCAAATWRPRGTPRRSASRPSC